MKADKKYTILVLMPYWFVNYESRFFKLVEILRKKHRVIFCVLTPEMNKNKEVYAPTVPVFRLRMPHFGKLKPVPIRSLPELYLNLLKANIVISGTTKGLTKVDRLIEISKIPYILVNDICDCASIYTYKQDILALPGEAMRSNAVFNNPSLDKQIVITGDLRFDEAFAKSGSDEEKQFLHKYGIKQDRPFAIFCTGSFQRIYYDPWLQELYKKIVSCLKKNDIQILLRVHHNDYAGHKRPKSIDKNSKELLFPEINAIDPEDVSIGMKLCGFVVSVDSSTPLDASVYKKYAVVVNFHEYSLKDRHKETNLFPKKRFSGFKICSLYKEKNGLPLSSELLNLNSSYYRTDGFRIKEYEWVGADCNIDEFDEVLNHPDLLKPDPALFDAHISKFWHKNDGQASLRVAELADLVITDKRYKNRLELSFLHKIYYAAAYSLKRIWKI